MSLSKPANFDQAQSVVPCDVCATETGEHYCTVCRQTLCNGCEQVHKKVASSKDHEVVPRVQMVSAVASTTCIQHPDQTMSLQCEPCQISVCIKCVTGDHRGHPMMELTKIYEDEKARVEKDILEIEQKTIPLLMKEIKEIPPKREEYQNAITGIRKEMEDEVRELKTRIDDIHARRLKKLAEEEATGLTQFYIIQEGKEEQKRSHTEDVSEYKAHVASKNQAQFLSYARKRGQKAHEHRHPTLKFPSPPKLRRASAPNTHLSKLLGKLITSKFPLISKQITSIDSVSSFITSFEHGISICSTDDRKAWVGGYYYNGLTLVDNTGRVLETRQTKNRTNALAMTSAGDIIHSPNKDDSRTVMKLKADGTEEPILNISSSFIKKVSVTEDDNVLICIGEGQVIICDIDGRNVRELYTGKKKLSAFHAIELPDRNICISDQVNKALVIVDRDGNVLKTIAKPIGHKSYSPLSLACDSMGNILSADENNDCVYIVSQKGDFRELVGNTHGIKEPWSLAVDCDDNLWIAQRNGYIKVVRYLTWRIRKRSNDQWIVQMYILRKAPGAI